MTSEPRISKTWQYFYSAIGRRKLVAEDRRLRRKAEFLGYRFKRLRTPAGYVRIVTRDGITVGQFMFESEAEHLLDRLRAEQRAVAI